MRLRARATRLRLHQSRRRRGPFTIEQQSWAGGARRSCHANSPARRGVGSLLLECRGRELVRVRRFGLSRQYEAEEAHGRLDVKCCSAWPSDALGGQRVVRAPAHRLASTAAAPGGSSGVTLAVRPLVVARNSILANGRGAAPATLRDWCRSRVGDREPLAFAFTGVDHAGDRGPSRLAAVLVDHVDLAALEHGRGPVPVLDAGL